MNKEFLEKRIEEKIYATGYKAFKKGMVCEPNGNRKEYKENNPLWETLNGNVQMKGTIKRYYLIKIKNKYISNYNKKMFKAPTFDLVSKMKATKFYDEYDAYNIAKKIGGKVI